MNNSVRLQSKDENEIRFLLHPFSWEEKKKRKKKKKTQKETQKNRRRKKIETHNFKNEDAKKNEDVSSWRTM